MIAAANPPASGERENTRIIPKIRLCCEPSSKVLLLQYRTKFDPTGVSPNGTSQPSEHRIGLHSPRRSHCGCVMVGKRLTAPSIRRQTGDGKFESLNVVVCGRTRTTSLPASQPPNDSFRVDGPSAKFEYAAAAKWPSPKGFPPYLHLSIHLRSLSREAFTAAADKDRV